MNRAAAELVGDAGPGDPAPPFPDGVRPFRAGDAATILELGLELLEHGELDGVGRHWLEESTAQLAREPELAAVAVEHDRVVGWVVPFHDDLSVGRRHRRRGHGTRLVSAGRIIAGRAGRPHLRLWVPRRDGPEAFARANGLRYHSSLWQMRLAPDAVVDQASFPESVLVRHLVRGVDEAGLVELVNAAFLDHPSPLTLDLERVRQMHAQPEFDPTTILVVAPRDEPDRMVAFCRIANYTDDLGKPVGEVKLVGVLPEFRGRGLGRELVRWGVDAVRRRGAGEVLLSVEGENDGALHLYATLGFERHVEWPHWTLPSSLPGPGEPGRAARD